MKKISRNELKNKPVIKVGYCAAQNMLAYSERIGYMSGAYGWNCDVYDFGTAYILTGYRMNVKGTREITRLTDCFNSYAQEYSSEHDTDTFENVKNYIENVIVRRYIKKTLLYA